MRILESLRLADWWNYKLPPLVAVGAWFLAGPRAVGLAAAATAGALFLAGSFGIATCGHLLNDWGDLDSDRRAGRPSAIAAWGPGARFAALAGALALALLPWLALPGGRRALGLVGLELALFAAYSLAPLRLKERLAAGVIADALYGHALPVAVTAIVFGALSARDRDPDFPAVFAALVAWKLSQGLSGALVSQIRDRRADRRSGTRTLALACGPRRALALVDRWLLPAHFVAFLVVLALAERDLPGVLLVYAIFVAGTAWRVHRVWRKPASFYHRDYPGYAYLNDFHERYFPLVALAFAVARHPQLAPLALAHLALFRSALSDLARAARARLAGARA